jgi:uncharacterized protein (TIGR02246 family)
MNRFKRTGLPAYASAAVILLALTVWPPATRALDCVPVTEGEIADLFVLWNNALQVSTPENPGPVTNTYAQDAILLPTVENGPMIGHVAISGYFKHFLKKKPSGTINERKIRIGCNIAFDAGLYTFTYGEQPNDPTLARYTYIYKYAAGGWLIAHHHSSVRPEPPKPQPR